MKVVITNVPSGKFVIGPRSTSFVSTPSPVNDGQHGEAERGKDDAGADHAAETDRGERQEAGAAVGLEVLRLGGGLGGGRRVADELVRRGGVDGRVGAGGVADPEQPEDDREGGAEDGRGPADDEADENAGDRRSRSRSARGS